MYSKFLPNFKYFFSDFAPYLVFNALAFLLLLFLIYKVFKSKFPKYKKNLSLLLIFAIFILVIIYTFSEAYFRFVYDKSDGLSFLRVNSKWQARHVIHNNYFYRDRDFTTQKEEGVKRIGVVGDSITFGGGIKKVEDRFSNLLEKKLTDALYKVEVYNLGKPGYDTDGEIAEYQKVKNLNFDVVVWEYFLNDIQPKDKSTGTPILVRESKKGEIVTFLSNRSYFFDFLYWRMASKWQKTLLELKNADLARYSDRETLENHKMQISQFIEDLNRENKKVVVIIFPLLAFLGPDYPANDIHKDMGEFFQSKGVEVIDLLDYLKGKNGKDFWASEFDSHPNENVHKLAAEKLFEAVRPLLK